MFNGHLKRNNLPISSLFRCKGRSNYSRSLHPQDNDSNKDASVIMPQSKRKKPLIKRFRREYYKFVDGFVRSHSLQKVLLKLVYFTCFIISVILATLLYLENK
ncbi:MAG TPA: hypothetical protein DCW45_00440 [Opitutae bacterium]|nr:hypothetical protein [Opitutae bacterium]